MYRRYGKKVEMKQLCRNLSKIRSYISDDAMYSEKFYNGENSSCDARCRICGSKDRTLFLKSQEKYNYYLCNNCKAVYLDNLPNVQKMYDNDESTNSFEYIDESIYKKRVDMISGPKVEFVLEMAENTINQWLDIGAGGGEILTYLKEKTNIEGVGIESDPTECTFIKKKKLKVYESFVDINKEDKEIANLIGHSEIVSLFNVLEHINNPKKFIDYIAQYMQKESYIVIEVPRHPSLASFANLTCPNKVYRHIESPQHLQVFSDESIEYILSDSFKVIGNWQFGQGYTDILTNSMILSEMEESSLYDDLMSISNEVQKVVDENGFADQMLVVAKKVN